MPNSFAKIVDDLQNMKRTFVIPFPCKGMNEAEVLSRLGFLSLVISGDYFSAERAKYINHVVRLAYLGDRNLNQKMTIINIQNGKRMKIERFFLFQGPQPNTMEAVPRL